MGTLNNSVNTCKLREALRGQPLEAIITVALVRGMRRDELLRLRWREIDLEKRELRVRDTKTQSSERQHKAMRAIAMDSTEPVVTSEGPGIPRDCSNGRHGERACR